MRRIVDIEPYFSGFVRMEQKDGWYSFRRFFDSQLKCFDDNLMFSMCARMNAGLRLRLRTDASRIEFTARQLMPPVTPHSLMGMLSYFTGNDKMPKIKGGETTPYGNRFDLIIDGVQKPSPRESKGCVSFALGEAGVMRDVEILFPYMLETEIRDIQLYECTSFAPILDHSLTLFLGDSVTQGANVLHSANTWYHKLSARLGSGYLNQGVCGIQFMPEILDGLSPLAGKPQRIFCALGTNDWGASSKATISERIRCMTSFFKKLHALFPNREIIVITPWLRLDEDTPRTFYSMKEWPALIQAEAEKYDNMRVIDGASLIPADPSLYYDRFLHPLDSGADVIASNLAALLAEGEA